MGEEFEQAEVSEDLEERSFTRRLVQDDYPWSDSHFGADVAVATEKINTRNLNTGGCGTWLNCGIEECHRNKNRLGK
jgi:hypothetical protein